MTCPACDNARERPHSGIFQMNCDGCAARAIAQSPEFFAAAKSETFTAQYRMALEKCFPGKLPAEAHQLVKRWAGGGNRR